MADDDYEWKPPSEAEMKIIQARRERSDKISKLLGDKMLKGYKMLGIVCTDCSTILLQDKQGVNYCVACKELDTDTDKDDPVLNRNAERSQILEGTVTDPVDSDDLCFMRPVPLVTLPGTLSLEPRQPASVGATQTVTSSGIDAHSNFSTLNFTDSVEVLCQKITWATGELQKSTSLDYCIHLCHLIKAAADAIQGLGNASR